MQALPTDIVKLRVRYLLSFAVTIFILFSMLPPLSADSQGPKYPTATAYPCAITHPTNAFASDNIYATGPTAGSTANSCVYAGFVFSVPAGSTIRGISVILEGNQGTCTLRSHDITVQVSNRGGLDITSFSTMRTTPSLPGTDTVYSLGGPTDLWGLTWTVAQANGIGVKVFLICSNGGVVGGTAGPLQLDSVRIVISYDPPAAAPTNPTALTLSPDILSSTSARLKGTVNPGGAVTSYDFSYCVGAAPNICYQTPVAACPGTLPAGTLAVSVDCTVTGLTPGETYVYDIAATNFVGGSYHNEVTFTMPPTAGSGAPIVTIGPPIIISSTSVTLVGSVNPNSLSASWRFLLFSLTGTEWVPIGPTPGTGCDGTLPAGTVQVAVSCTLSSLTAGHTYKYNVVAMNTAGTSASAYVSFTMPASGAAAAGTDWAVLSVGLSPPAPSAGDAVVFQMQLSALSTSDPFPQTVAVQCTIDGISCGSGTVAYPGPVGTPYTVRTESPWTSTIGNHMLTWSVSTTSDPHTENNSGSSSFTVPAPGDYTTTSSTPSETIETRTSAIPTTFVETTTATVQPSVSQSSSTTAQAQTVTVTSGLAENVMNMVQSNSLLVIGIGAIIVGLAVLAVGKLRRNKPTASAN
jgi:hypothetical protein